MTPENEADATRLALLERRARLRAHEDQTNGRSSLRGYMERSVWPQVPTGELGRVMSRDEEDRILGYGPHGY